jgi:hypothetical protein
MYVYNNENLNLVLKFENVYSQVKIDFFWIICDIKIKGNSK